MLSWAVAMQTLRAKQDEMEEGRRLEQAAEAEQLAAAAAVSEAAGEIAPEGKAVGGGPATPAQTGLRRRRGGSGDSGGAAGDGATEPSSSRAAEAQAAATAVTTAVLSLAAGALRATNPLHLATAVVRLPWQVLSAAGGVARWGLYRLPLVGEHLEDWIEGTPTSEQLEVELQELEAQLAELEHGSAEAGSNGAGGGGAGGSGDSTLRLSELAVQYGLSMLARSSGSTKAAIQPANQYERQLLDEVGWVALMGTDEVCGCGVLVGLGCDNLCAAACRETFNGLPCPARCHPALHPSPWHPPCQLNRRCWLPRTAAAASARWAPSARPRIR